MNESIPAPPLKESAKILPASSSLYAPLARPLFRAFWLAGVASNIGTWVQNVGAAWLVAELSPSDFMVASVQAATSLPVFFLALPAGAVADIFDRRRLLIGAQSWMFAISLVLAILTYMGWVNSPLLLAATFLIGLGTALNGPTWQAIVPELVSREEVPSAVALNSASMNLGKAVGPAIGGLLVAAAGAGAAFLVNALSFLGLIVVAAIWRRQIQPSLLPAERLAAAMRGGMRFVLHTPAVQAVLFRAAGFVIGGSGLWALLPLVAKSNRDAGPALYGIMLGCLGVGAVGGLLLLPWLTRRFTSNGLIIGGSLLFAAATLTVAQSSSIYLHCGMLAPAGAAWLVTLTRLNSAAQIAAPSWVRARALSVYLLVFFGGMAGGSFLWGAVADWLDYRTALDLAAAFMAIASVALFKLPLPTESEDFEPSRHWPDPITIPALVEHDSPAVITVEYRIDPGRAEEFMEAMCALRRARLRSGALRWHLTRDVADAGRFIEMFVDESWIAHMRHHHHVSKADQKLQAQIRAFHLFEADPVVTHLILAEPRREAPPSAPGTGPVP